MHQSSSSIANTYTLFSLFATFLLTNLNDIIMPPLNQLFDEILDSTTLSIYQIKSVNHYQVNQIIVISYQDIYAHIYTNPTY